MNTLIAVMCGFLFGFLFGMILTCIVMANRDGDKE